MVLYCILFTLLPSNQLFSSIYSAHNRSFLQPTFYLYPDLSTKERQFLKITLFKENLCKCKMNRTPTQENSKWKSKSTVELLHHSATQAPCPSFLLNAHSNNMARASLCTEIHFSILEEPALPSLSAFSYNVSLCEIQAQ